MTEKKIQYEKYAFASNIRDFLTKANFFIKYNPALVAPIIIYITALIGCGESYCLKAAREVLGVSHDTLRNMLYAVKYDAVPIVNILLSKMPAETWARGWIIIDDVILHKPHGTKTAYAFNIKDHTTNKYVWGIQVVVLLWSNGFLRIPLGYTPIKNMPGLTILSLRQRFNLQRYSSETPNSY